MLKVDLHIHSIHSGHAYGTIYDIINEAKRKKMKIIAITDHGPKIANGTQMNHFTTGHRKPETSFTLLWGVEANPYKINGEIDIIPKYQNRLDIILIGLHTLPCIKEFSKEKNTKMMINAIHKNRIHILSHPNLDYWNKFDVEKVMLEAIKCNILLEINLSYLGGNKTNLESFKRIVDITRDRGRKLIVNSDAHFIHEIGDDTILRLHWKALGMTESIMMNNYPEELLAFLKSK